MSDWTTCRVVRDRFGDLWGSSLEQGIRHAEGVPRDAERLAERLVGVRPATAILRKTIEGTNS